MTERVQGIATKPVNDDEDFLYLFFPETPAGRKSGQESLERLRYRLDTSHAAISSEAVRGHVTALGSFEGYWGRLDELTIPVLLANGTQDVMIHPDHTYAAARKLSPTHARSCGVTPATPSCSSTSRTSPARSIGSSETQSDPAQCPAGTCAAEPAAPCCLRSSGSGGSRELTRRMPDVCLRPAILVPALLVPASALPGSGARAAVSRRSMIGRRLRCTPVAERCRVADGWEDPGLGVAQRTFRQRQRGRYSCANKQLRVEVCRG
ncbi:hypothetical protein [Dactylosporangium sp. CA-139066]|uniref:hypothetical protein n=1 Tax=Dactylosporangium sp. CA-139066 TaxID=3239930 RepID=UPI003D8D146D